MFSAEIRRREIVLQI